jgi:demethylmenaquinone methyltransferase/2-methoxy-6-polyprenyl-1,4-benzoquinol methylase
VFLIDDAHRNAGELEFGERSALVRRRLNDGTRFRVVKVPCAPAELESRLRSLGWDITVTATPTGPFYWGAGARC